MRINIVTDPSVIDNLVLDVDEMTWTYVNLILDRCPHLRNARDAMLYAIEYLANDLNSHSRKIPKSRSYDVASHSRKIPKSRSYDVEEIQPGKVTQYSNVPEIQPGNILYCVVKPKRGFLKPGAGRRHVRPSMPAGRKPGR